MVEQLLSQGYLVIPTFDLPDLKKEFLETCKEFPEFKSDAENYVLGAFSALGNPGSFHNKFVRKIRQLALKLVLPFLSDIAGDRKLEQIIDRMLYRPKGRKPSADSWHRDEAPDAKDEDDIFGGWWNFDKRSQYFICVPGTHKGVSGHSGFGKLTSEEVAEYEDQQIKVKVPSNHIIIFYERIIHQVLPDKAPDGGVTRLFLGWRLTNDTKSLIPNLKKLLKDQAVMPIKSGQIPQMYSNFHKIRWREQLEKFYLGFDVRCLHNGVLFQKMKSLEEYLLPKYINYTQREIDLLVPNKRWEIINEKNEFEILTME